MESSGLVRRTIAMPRHLKVLAVAVGAALTVWIAAFLGGYASTSSYIAEAYDHYERHHKLEVKYEGLSIDELQEAFEVLQGEVQAIWEHDSKAMLDAGISESRVVEINEPLVVKNQPFVNVTLERLGESGQAVMRKVSIEADDPSYAWLLELSHEARWLAAEIRRKKEALPSG